MFPKMLKTLFHAKLAKVAIRGQSVIDISKLILEGSEKKH